MLKDGTTTEDPRLDRLVEFDEKSRLYNVADRQPLPEGFRSKTWRLDRKLLLDQGREGACVSTAVSHDLAAAPRRVGQITMDWARERIYWPAQRIDLWDGGSYPDASPQYEGTSVLAGIKVAADMGFYDEYNWAFNIDDAIAAVIGVGPIVMGINWHEGMGRPSPAGLIRKEGSIRGGHAVAWIGVKKSLPADRSVGPVAVIAQSWGLAHGDRGFVYLPLDDLEALLKERGECCVPIRANPSPRLSQL